jgi:hypothetical protein
MVCCLLLSACGSSGNTTVTIPTGNSPVISSPTANASPATRTPTRGNGGGATLTPTPTHHSGGATDTPVNTAGGKTGTPTPTRVSAAGKTLYVRASGNDSNAGTSPGAALQTVAQAVKLMGAGTTVYVGPGSYTEPGKGLVLISGNGGTASAPIQIIADPTGVQTGDAPGDVILDANGDSVAVQLDNSPFVIIDGFTITGAAPAVTMPTPGATPVTGTATEVEVLKSSDNVTIRNCVIGQSAASNGMRIDASVDVLVFNNLIIQNDRGIVITGGATGAQIINNTIVTSKHQALDLTQKGMAAPTGAMVLNNIIEAQTDKVAISVGQGPPSSQDGYVGDFNLVFESTATNQALDYSPNGMSGTTSIRGANDLNVDPLLINLGAGDVHLSHDSPAIDTGTDMIDSSLIDILAARSTRNDGTLDRSPVDMGYHYP